MSFREYLYFETNINYKTYNLNEIVQGEFKENIDNPILYFNKYIRKGYYPFYKEEDYELKLLNVINTILEVDLIQYLDLKAASIAKLKKLLQIVSESVPFKPNLSKISDLTQISRSLLPDYLNYLERAGIISLINPSTKGIQSLGKPEKIYLNNTNLSYVLVGEKNMNIGNARETFFMSHAKVNHTVEVPEKGDFLIDKYYFEVGSKNKTNKQILNIPNAYLVKDDIEYAYKNTIPLWHFGFLY